MPLLSLKMRLAFGAAILTLLIVGFISYRQVEFSAERVCTAFARSN
jgi:hypothetical protein